MNKGFLILSFLLLFGCTHCQAEIIQDEIASFLPPKPTVAKTYLDYNFESTVKIPVRLKILEPIKSEKKVYEGQKIKFKVAKNVVYKGNILIQRGNLVTATISVIITPSMNGIPASIIFKEFQIEGVQTGQFTENYEVCGFDRSIFVFPLKWALTPIPPTGSLTNFIMGGHAKIKENQQIIIHYYPDWK